MSWRYNDYLCIDHGKFEVMQDRKLTPTIHPCPVCGVESEHVISAPGVHLPLVTVVRGGVDAPPNPYALDTTSLGRREQNYGEWRAKRDKHLREIRRKQIKEWTR